MRHLDHCLRQAQGLSDNAGDIHLRAGRALVRRPQGFTPSTRPLDSVTPQNYADVLGELRVRIESEWPHVSLLPVIEGIVHGPRGVTYRAILFDTDEHGALLRVMPPPAGQFLSR